MAKIKNPLTGKVLNVRIPIYDDIKDAKAISQKAQKDRDAKIQEIAEKKQEAHDALELFGRVKIDVYDGSMRAFVHQFNRLKDVELTSIRKSEAKVAVEEPVADFEHIDFKAINGLKAAVVAGGAGAATGAAAFAGVGAFASASTGTAIATLHGVAATNATMAFLGGGSLAAGGGGMVVGAAVLGGLIAVPVLVVGGIYANAKANEALNKAQQDAENVKLFIRESDKAISVLVEIRTTSFTLKNVLLELDQRFVPLITELKETIDRHTYGPFLKRIYYALKGLVIKGLKGLGITPPVWLESEAPLNVSELVQDEKERVMLIIQTAQVIKGILDTDIINGVGLVPASVSDTAICSETFLSRLHEEEPIR